MPPKKKSPSRRQPRSDSEQPDRIIEIYHAIRSDDADARPNAKTLAKKFGTSVRTIRRDIKLMLKRGMPLAFDNQKHRFYFTEEDVEFPDFELTEAQIVSLTLSSQFGHTLRGTAHAEPFQVAHARLIAHLQKKTTIDLSKLHDYVSIYAGGQERNPDPSAARTIRNATLNQREITFIYHKADGSQKRRIVHPHHTRQVDGLWYLICHDLGNDKLVGYMHKRMTEVERTGNKFERRYTYDDIYNEFRNSLGIHSRGPVETVRLRFSGYAANYVPLKTWHHSEQFTELPGGILELTMQLAINEEVTRFVLQWGSEVEVLGPPALIEADDAHAERKWNKILERRARVVAATAAA